MKVTQKDIATIENAHDYLLEKSKLRLDTPLLSSLRDLSNRIYKVIDTDKTEAYLLTKDQIKESFDNPEKLKQFAHDVFIPELKTNKWYKVSHNDGKHIHIFITKFITHKDFICYGFNCSNIFFRQTDSMILNSVKYEEANTSNIHKLFKNEYLTRSQATPNSSFHLTIYNNKFAVDGNIVFENVEWIESAIGINSLISEAKKLEKKHNLKITLTFE